MLELQWYEAFPPRDASLTQVMQMVRVLAGRPHYGLRRLQPTVVFETWVYPQQVCWLLGIEPRIAGSLSAELTAQLPGLTLNATDQPNRPQPVTAREVRLTSMVFPLRLDTARGITAGLARLRDDLRTGEAVVLQWVVGPSQLSTRVPVRETPLDLLGLTTPRQPDGDEQRGWKTKLAEPLFGVRGRIGCVAGDPRRGGQLLRPLASTLALASGAHSRVYAGPQSSRTAEQLMRVMGRVRTWSDIANAGELAVLLGWCLGGLDVPGSAGRLNPPPPGLTPGTRPRLSAAARPLGMSVHPAAHDAFVWLPAASRRTGTHIIGPSGRGKSALVTHWALSEIAAGRSTVVIEPKGDTVRDIEARLPQHGNVVVIDPGADGPVVGINPLAGPRATAERRADSLLALLRELFGSAIGPRSADVLLHALIMAARLDDGTLTDVAPILTNPRFRRWVATRVSDPLTIGPWLAWFDNLSDADRGQVVQPVLNKLRPWTSRPAIRRLLGQPRPKFELASVFDRPTVLLVNLNAGAIGPEATRLIGSLLLSQLWEAVQRQTTRPVAARRPVTVLLDEWQSFVAGLDFADVLARARGANTNFVVAHQHLGQLSSDLQAATLANIGSRVVFRPAAGDSRALARVLGEAVKPEDLDQLAAFHAIARVPVDGVPGAAFEVRTPPLPDALRDPQVVQRASAERFGVAPKVVDAALLDRWQGGPPPDGPVGARRTSA